MQELNQIVRETEQFRAAEAEGKLTRLPTGDGMVLVFTNNPEAPVECALEISDALQSHPKLNIVWYAIGPMRSLCESEPSF